MNTYNHHTLEELLVIYLETSGDYTKGIQAIAEACTPKGCCGYCSGLGWVETEGSVRATCPHCHGDGQLRAWINVEERPIPDRIDGEYWVRHKIKIEGNGVQITTYLPDAWMKVEATYDK